MASTPTFDALFRSTYPQVVAYARRRTPTIADAEDVVADIYTTAWRRQDQLAKAVTPLAWLYGIGLNVIRNRRRSEDRHLRLVGAAKAQISTSAGSADPADAVVMRSALASLPDDDAELLRLVAWEGLSHAEAGEVLGCTSNAVGIRLHRARKRLDAALGLTTEPPQSRATST